jgi:branched-subunit amino acid aminotransferase/4-amino-4-deoxychorismate lyase
MTMPRWMDFNGRLVEPASAVLPAGDFGLLYGIGLFTTMRARGGRVFRLPAHLARLLGSAAALNLPLVREQLPDARRVERLLEANELTEARLRLTVTGGTRDGEQVRHNVLLTAVPAEPYPESYYADGVTACICPQVQDGSDPLAGHKTTCCWPRLMALHEAQRRGCAEALWFDRTGRLAEGSISNVFVVTAGTVQTPPPDTPVLPGITRSVVGDLCAREGWAWRETALTITDVLDADECFITNCIMGIVPVVRVEKRAIGAEKPGVLTRRLMAAYNALVDQECRGNGGGDSAPVP